MKVAVVILPVFCLASGVWASPDRFWRQPGEDVRYVAHQGEEAIAPNHTLVAYELACEHGLDFIKLDVQETKDGVIVTQHDKDLRAMYATNVVIREASYLDIQQHCRPRSNGNRRTRSLGICTLDEALSVAKRMKGGAWIDFKAFSPKLADRVMKRVEDCGLGLDRIMVATWSGPALQYVGEKYPSVRRVSHTHITYDPKTALYGSNRTAKKTFASKAEVAKAIAAEAVARGWYGVNVPTSYAKERCKTDEEMIRIFHEAGLWVAIWIVNTPAEGRYYRTAGADAFVTTCAASTERLDGEGGYGFAVPCRGIGGLRGDVTRYPDDPLLALRSAKDRGGCLAEIAFSPDEKTFAAQMDVLPREGFLVGVDCRRGDACAAARRIRAMRRLHQTYVAASAEALLQTKKEVPELKCCVAAPADAAENAAEVIAAAIRIGADYVRLAKPCSREVSRRAHRAGVRLILESRDANAVKPVSVRDVLIRRGMDFILTERLSDTLGVYWGLQKSRPFDVIEDEVLPHSERESFRVELPECPQSWEETAARELCAYLYRRIGPWGLTVGTAKRPVFHVGDTAFAKDKSLSSAELESEEWVVRSFGGDIILNGGGTRGCLYAVYHFLEDFCGIRWWSETEEDVPPASALSLKDLSSRGRPAFRYRDIYRTTDPEISTSLLAVRRRLNRNGDVPVPLALGGAIDYGSPKHCHTFNSYIPWEKLGKTNPELFSLVDGKRCGGQDYKKGGQLCLSNPEVYARVREGLEKSICESAEKARKENREAPRLFEVSMNDNWRFCQCANCQTETNQFGVSGQYLRFVNRLAGDVAKSHPDAYVTTLAYYFTEDKPLGGVRANDNVLVKLCNTRANMARSILTPGENDTMRGLLDVWQGLAKNLFVWDYDITYTKDSVGYPFPSEFGYADKFKCYRSHNVRGIFWEQENPDKSDLFDLKYYLKTKLFEDPDCDYAALLKRTFDEYYGPAGGDMYALRQRINEAAEKNDAHLKWFPQRNQFNFIRAADIAFCREAVARGEALVRGDARHLRRIRKTMAPFERFAAWRDGVILRHVPGMSDRLPPLKGLADGAFWEVSLEKFALYGKTNSVFVADASAPWGKAVELKTSDKRNGFPLVVGYYDAKTKKTTYSTRLKFQDEAGTDYAWYEAGSIEMSSNGYLYLTEGWLVHVHPTVPDLEGKKLDVRVLLAKTDVGDVRLARVVMMEAETK